MEAYLKWFEEVCEQFNVQPEVTTKTLQAFRESEDALTISQYVLDASDSEQVQYQALSALQYSFLKHWTSLDRERVLAIRNYIWSLITSTTKQFTTSVSKKLIMVFAIILKRNWLNDSPDIRAEVFNMISAFISDNRHSPSHMSQGARILSTIIEIFSKKFRAKEQILGFSPELIISIHTSFQKDPTFSGLAAVYQLTLMLLSTCFESTRAGLFSHNNGLVVFNRAVADAAAEICLLAVELFSWDFSSSTSTVVDESSMASGSFETSSVNLPKEWVEIAGGGNVFFTILQSAVDSYIQLRNPILNPEVSSHVWFCDLADGNGGVSDGTPSMQSISTARQYLSAFRQLILSLVSLSTSNSAIFPSNEEKTTYVETAMSTVTPLLSHSIKVAIQHPAGEIGHPTRVPSEWLTDVRAEEIEHIIYILIRLLGNFHLSGVGSAPSFEPFVLSLGDVTYGLATDMGTITEHRTSLVTQCCNPNASRNITDASEMECESVLDGWRGDILTQLLDLWAMLLDDPMMHGGGDASAAGGVVARLRSGLTDMAGQIFARLFDCIMLIALQDLIATEDEDLDEDHEDIALRNMDELLGGISLIGRSLALWPCLNHVKSHLERAATDFDSILHRILSGDGGAISIRECSRLLEIQRVCAMFLMHLCFEGTGIKSKAGAICSDGGNSNSEIPIVPQYILSSVREASSLGKASVEEVFHSLGSVMNAMIAICTHSLDAQRKSLSFSADIKQGKYGNSDVAHAQLRALEPLQSPLVMQNWFEFFKEYLRTYMGAESGLYDHPDIALFTRKSCGGSPSRAYISPSPSPTGVSLLTGLVSCITQCVWSMGAEHAMCISALGVLKVISVNLSPCEVYALSTDDTLVNIWNIMTNHEQYSQFTIRLSPTALSCLWESTLSLAAKMELCVCMKDVEGTINFGNNGTVPALPGAIFQQMCAFLHESASLSPMKGPRSGCEASQEERMSLLLACLRGSARCPVIALSSCDIESDMTEAGHHDHQLRHLHIERVQTLLMTHRKSISRLFDFNLPTLVEVVTSQSSGMDNDLRLSFLSDLTVVVTDYTEFQFSQLNSASACLLYESAIRLLMYFVSYQHTQIHASVSDANVIVNLLKFLDTLSSQEFLAPSDSGAEPTCAPTQHLSPLASALARNIGVSEVVCVGVVILSRVISSDILEHYTDLQDSYFSMLSYSLSSSPEHILLGSDTSRALVTAVGLSVDEFASTIGHILSLLLWGVQDSFNPSTARLALQGVQHCAVSYIRSGKNGNEVLSQFILHCQIHFVNLLLGIPAQPSSNGFGASEECAAGLSWDRIDAFSSAFLAVIAFDSSRFIAEVIPQCIASRPQSLQAPLSALFQKLTSDRGVNLSDFRKQNSRIFTSNLRDFFSESKLLPCS